MAGGWIARVKGLIGSGAANPPQTAAPSQVAAQAAKVVAQPELADSFFADMDALINAGHLDQAVAMLTPHQHATQRRADVLLRLATIDLARGRKAQAHATLRSILLFEPKHAGARVALTVSLFSDKEYAAAIAMAEESLRLGVAHADLVNTYGSALLSLGRYNEAAERFHQTLELNPDDQNALLNLQILDFRFGGLRKNKAVHPHTEAIRVRKLEQLTAAFRNQSLDERGMVTLIALTMFSRATFPLALEVTSVYWDNQQIDASSLLWLSLVFKQAGNHGYAYLLTERAFQKSPDLHGARQAMGKWYLLAGDEHWHEGWEIFHQGERFSNPPVYAREVPDWDGRPLGNEKLFVYQEQGFGDVVMALRFIPMLAARGIRVVLWTFPAIAQLAKSVPGYEVFVDSAARPDPRQHGCTFSIPMTEIMRPLKLERADLKTSPRLTAGAEQVAHWQRRVEQACGPQRLRRIGITAAGNVNRSDDWLRSIPPAALAPLAGLAGVQWFNLSVDQRPEVAELARLVPMIDLTSDIGDFSDTAALIENLDGVIAIDCSVAHIAAGVGKPLWQMSPPFLDWRWQIADDTQPWWPATLIRATVPGDWTEAVAQLMAELEKFLASALPDSISHPGLEQIDEQQ